MGYDLMGTTEKACPCGKSLTIESRYMDDWNRTKSEYEMVCEKCRKEYTHEVGQWVKIEDWQKKLNVVQKYDAKKRSVEKLAAEELADEWYQHFAHVKTKKALYFALTGYKEVHWRFSKEVAGKSIEEAIKLQLTSWIRSVGAKRAMEKISSTNPLVLAEVEELNQLLAEKKAAESEFRTKLN